MNSLKYWVAILISIVALQLYGNTGVYQLKVMKSLLFIYISLTSKPMNFFMYEKYEKCMSNFINCLKITIL